ncbi:sugar phosphate isomerase/epimerase family protein [uncultured Bacteroides sp.]|uniref:sugar phosphate isomerase/epimerase family protein n=1 Tax=uncultured Bacteroides sp. TaxID=162156 RepID=UPI00267743A3|nr:sugar phosphate isomerase/epimerase family protein [uncultured Bacteroides sp.]
MKKNLIRHIFWIWILAECFPLLAVAASRQEEQRYKIAVCDWMILKRQKIGSFQLVHELNGDGVELDMGSLGKREMFDNKLRDPHFQQLFRETARQFRLEVPSIAMSGFYGQSFLERANYKELVRDCLDAMKVMDAKVAFLPLGGIKAGWENDSVIREKVVKRLKEVGDMAASENLVIGIETQLDAKGDVKLLKEIDSPGIKIYFKFQNALENGRDLCQELTILGKERICQIHCTDTDGVTLPFNKRLDMNKVKKTLDGMGWSGWLVVERSRDKDDVRNVRKNYGTNINYLKEIFQ